MITQNKEYFFLPNFTRLYLKQTQNKIGKTLKELFYWKIKHLNIIKINFFSVLFKVLTNCYKRNISTKCNQNMLVSTKYLSDFELVFWLWNLLEQNFYMNGFLTDILCDNHKEINSRILKVFFANISDNLKLFFFDQLFREIEYTCDNFVSFKI